MSYAVQHVHGLRLVVFAEAGPLLKDENDDSLFIAPAFEHEAGMIALPVNRLDAAFFQLRSGVAGAVLQKFINYRLRVTPIAANRSGSFLLSPSSNSGLVPDGRQ
ncbi:DUF4180 domain-containing protein [Serratia bockelmannii]|uniref:DUF4180 domain-containing protein n=1 Tax=Serratia bockelmannii TaxID=2703793 RepID=UPI003FA6944D